MGVIPYTLNQSLITLTSLATSPEMVGINTCSVVTMFLNYVARVYDKDFDNP